MNPEPGRRFGPYEILDRLGGGGMGHVYRAWDARLHREVALKLLHSEYSMPGMRERFLLEARAASALNHPNICTVFDIGEQDGDPYLVMELLEGQSLKDLIAQGPIHRDELLCIAREMAEALGAAHAKGVVHRDIKPGNVFLVRRPNGSVQAKILDFGLAKMERRGLRSAREADLTTLGATVGTLAYMSPEQARGEALDARSDLFSLGVVMYEMATGTIPFPGATSALVFVKLLNQPPEPVRSLNEAIPREVERVINKLLAKDPGARFQTAQEAEQAIRQAQERGSSGGWLRRAVDAGRPARPVSREGSPPPEPRERLGGLHAVATPLPETVQPKVAVLRPVVRMPQGNARAGVLSQPLPPPQSAKEVPRLRSQSQRERAVAAVGLESGPRTPWPDPGVQAAPPGAAGVAAAPPEPEVDPAVSVPPSSIRPVAQAVPAKSATAGHRLWLRVGFALALLLSTALLLRRERMWPFGGKPLEAHATLLVAPVENRSGDRAFDDSVTPALHLALGQSPYFDAVVDRPAMREGTGADGQAVARRIGASAYLQGMVENERAPFLLHIAAFDAASGKQLASVDRTISSEVELAAAIDSASSQLRRKLGEPETSVAHNSAPLAADATESVAALGAFEQAQQAQAAGRTLEALAEFQRAVQADPHFVQAQLGLAEVYTAMHAEVAAASAARQALAVSESASERTRALAQGAYQIDATGDLPRAVVTLGALVAAVPRSDVARALLARALRLEGRLSDALATAQVGCSGARVETTSCSEAATALVGMNRPDEAAKMLALAGAETDGQSVGMTSAKAARPGVIEMQDAGSPISPAAWRSGISLDAAGKLAAGAELWRVQAAAAGQVAGLESTASFLLAQGAIDRALLGDCTEGLPMAHQAGSLPSGMTAIFNEGMTEALCGDRAGALAADAALRQRYPQSFLVNGFMLADLRAAMALRAGDANGAVDVLETVRAFDSIAPSTLLRGWAEMALGRPATAESEFEATLVHHGAAVAAGSNAEAAAELGLARAFAAAGDRPRSAASYRRLAELWRGGDQDQPILIEARSRSR